MGFEARDHGYRLPGATALVLDSHLAPWRGWMARSRCLDADCPPNRLIAVGDILAARGDVTLLGMAEGLRCHACGAKAGSVSLVLRSPAGEIVQPLRGRAALFGHRA
ncbi:hypothetical protein BKE38_03935 [Pseudoroseomonas deserti]|uniref:Uncharacterized protein n=1 Tax=Teichococcus deserti TaxID=1817963 RepID=A0A1V2H6I9_9PROT|nr:hypothetical protein [Pseudoroseomonas deserti]ONG57871.1 hypothetical protein BKE38_03935 [Pseudoroseomonas deserti]